MTDLQEAAEAEVHQVAAALAEAVVEADAEVVAVEEINQKSNNYEKNTHSYSSGSAEFYVAHNKPSHF
jgi:hypothetical protein